MTFDEHPYKCYSKIGDPVSRGFHLLVLTLFFVYMAMQRPCKIDVYTTTTKRQDSQGSLKSLLMPTLLCYMSHILFLMKVHLVIKGLQTQGN